MIHEPTTILFGVKTGREITTRDVTITVERAKHKIKDVPTTHCLVLKNQITKWKKASDELNNLKKISSPGLLRKFRPFTQKIWLQATEKVN